MKPGYNTELFLITNSYPFGAIAESFLDKELPYLSQFFENVTIVPLSYPLEVEYINRELPNNVFCDTSFVEQGRIAKKNRSQKKFKEKIKLFSVKPLYKEVYYNPRIFYDRNISGKMINYLNLALRMENWLKKYIKKNNVNLKSTIFYTYWMTWATLGIGLTKSVIKDIKLVSRAHGYDLYEERHSPPYIPFRTATLSKIDKLYLVSEHGKNYIIKKYPLLKNKVKVSRLGVTPQKTLSESSSDGAFRLLSCSYIVPVKRIELIIRGLNLIGRKRPYLKIIWTHIGYGLLMEEIAKLASDTLPNNVKVKFLGFLKNPEVLEYYRENPIDVFINTSSSEGVPVSIMEAQSFGVPAIAPRVGGVPEIVSDNCGILLNENPSPLEISDAIEFFINNKDLARKKRVNSYMNWDAKFNAEKNFCEFVKQLINL
ncbi:glycosyltransferase [Candidatus Bathyarchaeota archaeon]|nr:glycosyltransferase [Candidatus Bathyarchaeota archaeon]